MAKSGDLRVLKSGAIYGPLDRAALEQMIESGRIDRSDQVSVRGAPWASIDEFLTATPAASAVPSPAAPPSGSTASGSTPRKQGSLRVLRGNRMVGSLDRGQVEQLYAVGRLGDDDLICAKGGPWMLVGDFLAPPPPRSATNVTPAAPTAEQIDERTIRPPIVQPRPVHESRVQPPAMRPPVVHPLPIQPPVARPVYDQPPVARPIYDPPPVARPVYDQPPRAEPLFAQPVDGELPVVEPTYDQPGYEEPVYEEPEWVTPEDAAVETAIRRDLFAELDEPVLKDEWYVRVRGIHSAPLKKQHVRMLLESREITLDAAARHCTWRETDWRAIRSIPQLAGIAE